jgi:hypothetical protein
MLRPANERARVHWPAFLIGGTLGATIEGPQRQAERAAATERLISAEKAVSNFRLNSC